jgi:hypothetical protein
VPHSAAGAGGGARATRAGAEAARCVHESGAPSAFHITSFLSTSLPTPPSIPLPPCSLLPAPCSLLRAPSSLLLPPSSPLPSSHLLILLFFLPHSPFRSPPAARRLMGAGLTRWRGLAGAETAAGGEGGARRSGPARRPSPVRPLPPARPTHPRALWHFPAKSFIDLPLIALSAAWAAIAHRA